MVIRGVMIYRLWVTLLIHCLFFPGMATAREIRFIDVTVEAGLPPGPMYSFGPSWGYLNGDAYPDVIITHHDGHGPRELRDFLLLNGGGGTFQDVSDALSLNNGKAMKRDQHTSSWAALFSRDPGSLDLYQAVGGRKGNLSLRKTIRYIFYVNEGGVLRNRAVEKGLQAALSEGPLHRGYSALPLDFDRDGHTDLLLTGLKSPFRLLKNNGLNFSDVSVETGIIDIGETVWGWQAATGDLNGDGYDDLVFGGSEGKPFSIFLNESGTGFISLDVPAKPPRSFLQPMIADMNSDGLPDLLLLPSGRARGKLFVLLNKGKGVFTMARLHGTNLALEEKNRHLNGGDFDNDGDMDILVATEERLTLLENVDGRTFRNITEPSGIADTFNRGRAGEFGCASLADFDLDGRLDILAVRGKGGYPKEPEPGPVILAKNMSRAGNYLRIMLKGVESNPQGLGAAVTVEAGELRISRQAGNGVRGSCQNDTALHVGIGDALRARVTVEWPSGKRSIVRDIGANMLIEIVEEGP